MIISETPRTAEQLSSDLKNRAFDCGKDESIDNPSQARLDRHEAALNKAEKDVIERITTLERELAAMTARAEHIESSLAVVTAERDAVRRDHNGCALWAEASRRERDALKADKELAERQVAVLRTALEDAATRLHTANVAGAFQSGDELSEYLATGYQNAHRVLEAGKEGGNG